MGTDLGHHYISQCKYIAFCHICLRRSTNQNLCRQKSPVSSYMYIFTGEQSFSHVHNCFIMTFINISQRFQLPLKLEFQYTFISFISINRPLERASRKSICGKILFSPKHTPNCKLPSALVAITYCFLLAYKHTTNSMAILYYNLALDL